MKYSNRDLFRQFAVNPSTNASNNNGTLFIENSVIYSYGKHFPMAQNVHGIVLFTTDSYSATTGKQLGQLRNALCRHSTIFYVANVVPQTKKEHSANFMDFKERYKALLLKASKARTNKDLFLQLAESMALSANEYADTFKLQNKRIVHEQQGE